MDKYWWFGKESLWCRLVSWLKHPEWCLYQLEPIPPDDSEPIDDEIEKVEVTVCYHSNKLPGRFCIHRQKRIFEKGKEPVEKCDLHAFEVPSKREEMCLGALGIFLCFLRTAWKEKDQIQAEEQMMQLLAKFASYGFKYIDFFDWLSDGKPEHKFLNEKTPFHNYRLDGKLIFRLKEYDPRWWELFEQFLRMLKLFKFVPCNQYIMDRYCYYPFASGNNEEGVEGFWTEKAFKYIEKLVVDLTVKTKEVFGNKHLIKFINEPAHGGNDAKFHEIALFHRRLFEAIRPLYTTKRQALKKVITDNSMSEAGQLLLCWHSGGEAGQVCPKCGRKLIDIFGKTYATEPWMKRLRIGEQHSISIVQDLEAGHKSLSAFFGSANKKARWHEDGGASDCSIAKGIKFGNLCFADAKQYGDMCETVWLVQKNHSKKKKCYVCIFPVETLKIIGKQIIEDYRIEVILWDRFDEMLKRYKKVFG